MKTKFLVMSILALGFTACDYGQGNIVGGGYGGSGGGNTPPPAINISGPGFGSSVMVGTDNLVPVSFDVTNFVLKMPGTCGGDTACGHVHLKVDGAACNNVAAMKPYNAAGFASPISANLTFCPTVEGTHDISIELHHDDHSAVKNDNGGVVSSSSQFTAQRNSTATAPTIAITMPMPNSTVTMAAGQTVPVGFSVSYFTLKAPGTCVAADGACGHVHLKVDGDACNNVAGGKPYNNAGYTSPMSANLAFCPTAAGMHTILLELHANDHTPVLDNGVVVSATVAIRAQ